MCIGGFLGNPRNISCVLSHNPLNPLIGSFRIGVHRKAARREWSLGSCLGSEGQFSQRSPQGYAKYIVCMLQCVPCEPGVAHGPLSETPVEIRLYPARNKALRSASAPYSQPLFHLSSTHMTFTVVSFVHGDDLHCRSSRSRYPSHSS